MDLPAERENGQLTLVMLNGVTLASDEWEIRGKWLRLETGVGPRDHLRILTFASMFEVPVNFECVFEYRYDSGTWFDPSDQHDPKVKQLPEPPLRVTQL